MSAWRAATSAAGGLASALVFAHSVASWLGAIERREQQSSDEMAENDAICAEAHWDYMDCMSPPEKWLPILAVTASLTVLGLGLTAWQVRNLRRTPNDPRGPRPVSG